MLPKILSHGFITEKVYDNCVKIRSLFLKIEKGMPELYNVSSVRNGKIRYEIMSLCDDTLRMLM
ncbi:MAG: hypothetical protein NC078_03435 [Ruminococcus sp.]|nr:hypothetical protein [Ruminococcus sp.]